MEFKDVGKEEFFQMIEKLKDFAKELVIWEPVAHQMNIDLQEIKASTRTLLQIMQVVDKQIEADPSNEAIKRQSLSFYEMGEEICTRFEELHNQLEDRSDRH
jgi:hypothetical protein